MHGPTMSAGPVACGLWSIRGAGGSACQMWIHTGPAGLISYPPQSVRVVLGIGGSPTTSKHSMSCVPTTLRRRSLGEARSVGGADLAEYELGDGGHNGYSEPEHDPGHAALCAPCITAHGQSIAGCHEQQNLVRQRAHFLSLSPIRPYKRGQHC